MEHCVIAQEERSLEGSVCGLSGRITFKPGTWLNFPHMEEGRFSCLWEGCEAILKFLTLVIIQVNVA